MSIRGIAYSWNATDEDWWAPYPCDRHVEGPCREMMRAVEIQAPADLVYRWVCQLQVAPYSYDWLDNWGRRSPRRLTPGAERVTLGQSFLIGPIVEFKEGRHLTAVIDPPYSRFFGACSITYAVKPTGPVSCRLVVKLDVPCSGRWGKARAFLLAWGDLIMMRKQLLTLKALAEKMAHAEAPANLAGVGARPATHSPRSAS
ncbi:MAG: SRPBCC family protein [Thermoleophilia bacterium]|nr:SRPBCC family protein [Thermoleophilia bacterium]